MKARTPLVAVACIIPVTSTRGNHGMPANCEAQTMKQVQQAYTPLAGLSDSDSYVMFGVGWALAFQWPPRAFRRIAWSSACRGHGQPWVIGVYCYWIGLAGWLTVPVQLNPPDVHRFHKWAMWTSLASILFLLLCLKLIHLPVASASLTTRRGVVNAILCRRLVHHGRAVICLCTTAKRGGSTSLGSTCEIPMVLNCVSCVSMLAPFSESGALVFSHMIVRRSAGTSELLGPGWAGAPDQSDWICVGWFVHLYKPISIIWILYNSPRHNDQLRKEWWISSYFELWFLKRIQKLLVMRTTLGSPSAQGHCQAVIALRNRAFLMHSFLKIPLKRAHGMSRTGNSYWNGKHLHRNQDEWPACWLTFNLVTFGSHDTTCRHPFHNGSLRIFSVWKWYQLMIGWCRQTKVKMFQWMIDENDKYTKDYKSMVWRYLKYIGKKVLTSRVIVCA